MPPPPLIPPELRHGPFTFREAQLAGLTRRHLRGRSWQRVAGLYAWAGLPATPDLIIAAVHRRLPPGAAFSGRTAAWLWGLDVPPCSPVEVTVPDTATVKHKTGLTVHQARLEGDVVVRRGRPVTRPLRTVCDLACTLPRVEAVVILDMTLRAGLVSIDTLTAHVAEHAGRRGIRKIARMVDLAEPLSESPMESRLRVLLLEGGLPRPQAQVTLRDPAGRFLARPDLLFPERRLAIEFDGGIHRDTLVEDNRRQNRLISAGYQLLRFTGSDVYSRPDSIVAQVRSALRSPDLANSRDLAATHAVDAAHFGDLRGRPEQNGRCADIHQDRLRGAGGRRAGHAGAR